MSISEKGGAEPKPGSGVAPAADSSVPEDNWDRLEEMKMGEPSCDL
jgi:hypothetical protein